MSHSIPNNTHVVRIKAVNGLLFLTYDDDATTSTSGSFLSNKGVTHVLSIINGSYYETSQKSQAPSLEGVQVKQITISNNPAPDVLSSLNDASKWIENALTQQNTNQVLIKAESHRESIISNAILLGFIMRYLRTTFSTALRLAQESVPTITVGSDMERQLRIWEFCRYNIYQIDPQSTVSSPKIEMSMPGTWPLSRVNTGSGTGSGSATPKTAEETMRDAASGLHKPAYLAWRKECDALVAAERSRALSKMAALMAKKRIVTTDDSEENESQHNGPQGCAKDFQSRASKEAQWARVEEMEKSWNDKLMKGAVMA